MLVSCNMRKKVRVSRSAYFFIFLKYILMFAKGDFVGKIGGKVRFATKKKLKIVKTGVIYVKK